MRKSVIPYTEEEIYLYTKSTKTGPAKVARVCRRGESERCFCFYSFAVSNSIDIDFPLGLSMAVCLTARQRYCLRFIFSGREMKNIQTRIPRDDILRKE